MWANAVWDCVFVKTNNNRIATLLKPIFYQGLEAKGIENTM
jgi:hypothetical protein